MFQTIENTPPTLAERFPRLTIVLGSAVLVAIATAWCLASLHAAGYTTILDRWAF
jgi:hypothetical protein